MIRTSLQRTGTDAIEVSNLTNADHPRFTDHKGKTPGIVLMNKPLDKPQLASFDKIATDEFVPRHDIGLIVHFYNGWVFVSKLPITSIGNVCTIAFRGAKEGFQTRRCKPIITVYKQDIAATGRLQTGIAGGTQTPVMVVLQQAAFHIGGHLCKQMLRQSLRTVSRGVVDHKHLTWAIEGLSGNAEQTFFYVRPDIIEGNNDGDEHGILTGRHKGSATPVTDGAIRMHASTGKAKGRAKGIRS